MATPSATRAVHPLVRDLMKRCIVLKHDHYDPQHYMNAVRREFGLNKDLSSDRDIMKAVAYGRWMVREEQGRVRFKQYRMLQQRYNPEFDHHPHSQFPNNQEQFHQSAQKQQFGNNNPFGKQYNEAVELKKLERGEE
jgi:hypothetical protein